MDDKFPETKLSEERFPQDPTQGNLLDVFSWFYPEELPGRYYIYGIYMIMIPDLYEFVAAIVTFDERGEKKHRRK